MFPEGLVPLQGHLYWTWATAMKAVNVALPVSLNPLTSVSFSKFKLSGPRGTAGVSLLSGDSQLNLL